MRLFSIVLNIGYHALAYHIVTFFIDTEHPRGPRRLLRLGRWDKLLEHTRLAQKWASYGKTRPGPEQQIDAFWLVEEQVKATREKWFVFVDTTGEWRWVPGEEAVEVSRRLATGGDPRPDRGVRRLRLFDVAEIPAGDREDEAEQEEEDEGAGFTTDEYPHTAQDWQWRA